MKDENEPFGGFLNEACDANREIGRLQAIIDDLHNSSPECMEAIYQLDIIKFQAEVDSLRASNADLRRKLADAEKDARKAALDDVRALLCKRSKGEVETWGFVAAFMGMIDEVERQSARSQARQEGA